MSIREENVTNIKEKARELRLKIVDTTVYAGGAHIGGALSSADILTLLYFDKLNIDVQRPDWEDRDRFILSKGHSAVGYIPVLAMKGFLNEESLKTFNHFKSPYGMHPDSLKIKGCDVSAGSLGHGLSMAVGMGLAAKQLNKDFYTYCLMGDGECNEGSVWEAAMSAAHYKLDNIVVIIDRNKCLIDGFTEDVMALEPLDKKWIAFGFNTIVVNGHDIEALSNAIEEAKALKDKPTVIIADTIKGKGVDFMEGDPKWHYGSIDSELAAKAKESISGEAI